jgi:putative Mn2+ efflux pump MntP
VYGYSIAFGGGFGLAVDAFSVSVAYGLKSQGSSGEALKMALSFGFLRFYACFRLVYRFRSAEFNS